MEPSIREDLNATYQDLGSKYINMLSPISCAMFDILQSAEVRREDRILSGNRLHHPPSHIFHEQGYFNKSFLLFKGVIMKQEWIIQWLDCMNQKGLKNRHTG